MKMFAEASGKDLKTWQNQWLKGPGVNTVRANVTCVEESPGVKTISKLVLQQGNAEYSSDLRTHRAEIALYAATPMDSKPGGSSRTKSSTSLTGRRKRR